MAPIDIVQAQAEVATNESSVIVAEAAIKQAQDNLRALILDPGDAGLLERRPSSRATRASFDERADRPRRRGAQRARQAVRPPGREERARAERHQHQVLPQPDQAGRQRAASATTRSASAAAQLSAGRHRRRRGWQAGEPDGRRRSRGFGSVLGDVLQQRVSARGRSACRSATRSARTRRTPTSRA